MGEKPKAKTLVLISYNPVNGFASGWHGNRKLFVCASDNGRGRDVGDGQNEKERAGSVMHKISGDFYKGSVPVENVREFVVYAGLNALEGAIYMAKGLKEKAPSVPVTVAACRCDWDKKKNLLAGTDIRIISCECSGRDTLGNFAKQAVA